MISEKAYSTLDRMTPVVESLLEAEAIETAGPHSFKLSRTWRELDAEVIAVETKLTRWSDAWAQAISYRRFADKVVVAMDGKWKSPTGFNIEDLESDGIGFCVVDPAGIEWLTMPRRIAPENGADWHYIITSAADSNQRPWALL